MQTIDESLRFNVSSRWTKQSKKSKTFWFNLLVDWDYETFRPMPAEVKSAFIELMQQNYGPPNQRWGFRLDNQTYTISLFFKEEEDAVMFMLTNK